MFVNFTRPIHQYLSRRPYCSYLNQDLGVLESIPFCYSVQALKHMSALSGSKPLTYTFA